MLHMHKKINKREFFIGWYSFWNKITKNDLNINRIFYSYTKKPLFFLIWIDRDINGLIIEAYSTKKSELNKFEIFQKEKVSIGMLESEDIGVHQILRDSQKWNKNFRTNTLINWYQIFTSFSKFFRKLINHKTFISRYKGVKKSINLTKNFINFTKNSKVLKKDYEFDLILIYLLNILKLNLHLENNLFQVII